MEGTEDEIAAGVVLEVQEASRFYANRGASTLGRVYLTITTPTAGLPSRRVPAERADRQAVARPRRKELP